MTISISGSDNFLNQPVKHIARRFSIHPLSLLVTCVTSVALIGSAPILAGQTCPVTCANSCGPRADFPAAVYNKCVQTCTAKCNSCQTSTAPPAVAFPKFYVAGLFYAPPGCTSTAAAPCATQSSVDYVSGSSAGTKISSTKSFQSGLDVKVDATLSLGSDGKSGFGLGGSFGYSTTDADSSTETLTKSTNLEEKATGNQDGVDHDEDTFLLLLNPAIAAKATHTFGDNVCHVSGATWNFGINTKLAPTQALYKVTVGGLKNPASLPADVAAQLKLLNFTPADFQTILNLDPFAANPQTTEAGLDATRFTPTTISFPYEPPDTKSECNAGVCSCLSLQATLKNEFQLDNGISNTTEYKVGVSQTGGINAGVFHFGESINLNYTWTSISTQDDITGSSQSASAAVQCPSPGYSGPTFMEVVWDNLFGSFVFVPTVLGSPGQPVLTHGILTGATGAVKRHQLVDLTIGGKTFHTYTDSQGKYAFPASPRFKHGAQGTLSALGTKRLIALGSTQNIKGTSR